jgi:hypothetical protein
MTALTVFEGEPDGLRVKARAFDDAFTVFELIKIRNKITRGSFGQIPDSRVTLALIFSSSVVTARLIIFRSVWIFVMSERQECLRDALPKMCLHHG